VYLLFNHPGETPATARETMAFVESVVPGDGPVSGRVSSQSWFVSPGTANWDRLEEYRRDQGTEVRHPEWWRMAGDHHALATDVVPSSAFGKSGERRVDFRPWQDGLNDDWARRHPLDVVRFLDEFYGSGLNEASAPVSRSSETPKA
jgi:hypothetical protein